jgi:hypothetical protein
MQIIDRNINQNINQTRLSLEKLMQKKIEKFKKKNPSDDAKELYELTLNLFNQFRSDICNKSNCSTIKAEVCEKQSLDLLSSPLTQTSSVQTAPLDRQAINLIQTHFFGIEKILKDLKIEIDFKFLSSLSLEYVCELIVFICFFKVFESSPLLHSSKKNSFFYDTINHLLEKKRWKNIDQLSRPTLLKNFKEFCTQLNMAEGTTAPFNMLIVRIQILSQQQAYLSLSLKDLEIKSQSEQPSHPLATLRTLISIQSQLFKVIDCIFLEMNGELKQLLEFMQTRPSIFLEGQIVKINKTSIFDNINLLKSNLKCCIFRSKIRNVGARLNCKAILNPSVTEIEIRLHLNQLLSDSPRFSEKIKKAEQPLKRQLLRCQAGYELFLPGINLHELAKKNIRELFALDCLIDADYYEFIKNIFVDFLKENPEFKNKALNAEKDPSFVEVFNFIISSTKIKSEDCLSQKIVKKRKSFAQTSKENSSDWYKKFQEMFIKRTNLFYPKFFRFFAFIRNDLLRKHVVIEPLDPDKMEKQYGSKVLNNFIGQQQEILTTRTKEILTSRTKDREKATRDLDRACSLEEFFNTIIARFSEKAHENFACMHDNNRRFRNWLENVVGDGASSMPNNLLLRCDLFEGLNKTNKALASLTSASNGFEWGNFLMPAISASGLGIGQESSNDWEAWLFSIDGHSQTRPEKKTGVLKKIKGPVEKKKNQKKSPSKYARTSVEKKKERSFPKAKSSSSKPPLRTKEEGQEKNFDQIQFDFNKGILPPHQIHQAGVITEKTIFFHDQMYHLHQAFWTLELILKSLQEKKQEVADLSLLASKLIDHLYHAQEQGVTPFYLEAGGDLRHGLVEMSQRIGLTCTEDLDLGSWWNRYSYPSANLYTKLGKPLPAGLQVILDLNDKQTINTEKARKHYRSLLKFTQGASAYIRELTKHSEQEGPQILELIRKLERKTKELNTILEKSSVKGDEERESLLLEKSFELVESQNLLRELQRKVRERIQFELEKNSLFKTSTLEDLAMHIHRLIVAIDLMERFPEQRFLSLHEHNLRMCGQYLIEIAFSAISQIEGDEFHTHHFKAAYSLLEMGDLISQKEWAEFKELNIQKGIDYPYWSSWKVKEKQGSIQRSLQHLSEAFHFSLEAEIDGEGFIPVTHKLKTLNQKREGQVQLIKKEAFFLKKLIDKKIALN